MLISLSELKSLIKKSLEERVDPERSAAAKKLVVRRRYEPKKKEKDLQESDLEEKEYKAIPATKKYVKSGGKGFKLGDCMDDLKGKKGIENPAAVCRSAEIAHTGKAHGTR